MTDKEKPLDSDTAPKNKIGEGLIAGGCAGSIIMSFGLLLCLTGIGAIIGIPMILIGCIIIPFIAATHKVQKCPACKKEITLPVGHDAFDCPICKERLFREGKTLTQIRKSS